jgi:predicted metal-dependent peptidase
MKRVEPRSPVDDCLARARQLLLMNYPFFGSLALQSEYWIHDKLKTAATNGRLLLFGEQFVLARSKEELAFVLAHELMHINFLHVKHMYKRNRYVWNLATDVLINHILIADGMTPPKGELAPITQSSFACLRNLNIDQLTSEQIYDILMKNATRIKVKVTWGEMQEDEFSGPTIEVDPDEVLTDEQEAAIRITQAATLARQQGRLPAGISRLIDAMLVDKRPWQRELAELMERLHTGWEDENWAQPDRHFVGLGITLPSWYTESAGTLAIAVDSSGSIGPKELAAFWAHGRDIVESISPEKVYFIWCDAAIHQVDEYEGTELPQEIKAVKGGGGTDFVPVFEWVKAHAPDAQAILYLTDGYGTYPEQEEIPSIWLMTTALTAPIGRTIQLESL